MVPDRSTQPSHLILFSVMLQFYPPGFRSQTWNLPQGQLHYYTQGDCPWDLAGLQDAPILVFLHSLGGGSSAFEWSKVFAAFGQHYRIVAPDLIGWGCSSHPPKNYTLEDYLEILRDFFSALQQHFGRSVHCCLASSVVAAMLVRLAVENPRLSDRLCLVSPSGYRDFGKDYRQGVGAQLAATPVLDRLIYGVGAANEFAIQNFMSQFLFAQPERITEEMIQAYLASAQQPNAEYAALSALRGDLFFDLAETIEQLPLPTTLIWGQQAKFSAPAIGRRLQQANPTAIQHFYEIPDAGVLPHLEQPATVIALLNSIL